MCQGNRFREVYDNSYRILDSLWWLFVKYFSVCWDCLKLCYFASKLSTSEDVPAISELPEFLSQMFHSKILSQLYGKSLKLQKSVMEIISLNVTHILISRGRIAQKSETWIPILLLIYLNKFQFQHSKLKWQTWATQKVKIWNIFRSYYSSCCFNHTFVLLQYDK